MFGPGAKLYGYDYVEYDALGDDFSAPKHSLVRWASMSMRGEAGYMHVKDAWSTILRKQVITHIVDGTQVGLQAEIVVETGCMLSFAISRVLVKDIRALRSLTLLPCERYVKILDLSRLWNRRTQSFCGERRYVTISYNVYESCYLYLSSLAPTSKTYANLLNYMRKAKGGISLVSKELVAPWNLDPRDHEPLALAVYVRVMQDVWQHEEIVTALVESRPKSFIASLAEYSSVQLDWLSSWFANISKVRSLVEHLTAEGIIRGLVVVPPYERRQVEFFHPEGVGGTVAREIAAQADNGNRLTKAGRALLARTAAARVGSEHGVVVSSNDQDGVTLSIPTAAGPVTQEFAPAVELEFGEPFEADEHYCPRCAVMQELGGEQRFVCKHLNRPTVYCLHLTEDDVAQTVADWQGQGGCYTDDCQTPEALRKTLNEAAARLPRDGCSINVEVELWNAGPGTGKSYMIKQMYQHDTEVIVAPFRALNATYPAPHFRYFTTHRALSHIVGNFDTLYVDEFTCYDFRAVIALAFNHGVRRIVLVGDPMQNVIRPETRVVR